jgi:hypothetical protein
VPSGETQFGAGPAQRAVPVVEPPSWRTAVGLRAAAGARSERTSPLVGRRDPLGVGLRPGDQSRPLAGGCPGVPADRPAVVHEELARGTFRVTRRRPGRTFAWCPRSGLPDAAQAALSARDPLRLGRRLSSATLTSGRPTRPVLKHGPRSPACARVDGNLETRRRIERKGPQGLRGDGGLRAARTPGASRSTAARRRKARRTKSAHAGTRKMVNYAWPGRSQGKP